MGLASGYLSQDFSGLNDFFPPLHFSILPLKLVVCDPCWYFISCAISFRKGETKIVQATSSSYQIFWRHCKAALFMKLPPTVCTYKGEDRTKTNPVSTPSPPPQPSTTLHEKRKLYGCDNWAQIYLQKRCKNFYICRRSPSTKSGQKVFFKAWKYLLADVFSPPTLFFFFLNFERVV